MKFLDKILIEGKYNNLPADHFMCEENTLHLGVSDMVTTLILNDLEENETKMIKKSHSSELNSDSCTWVGIASNQSDPKKGGDKKDRVIENSKTNINLLMLIILSIPNKKIFMDVRFLAKMYCRLEF